MNFNCHEAAVAWLKSQMNQRNIHLELLKKIESNPDITQRQLSKEMGVSLGKVNYCLNKLIKKGLVKIKNFSKNLNKKGYVYLLTTKGIEEKSNLTLLFLKSKIEEYELLRKEIAALKKDSLALNSEKKIDEFP